MVNNFYHVTKKENLDSIIKIGLIPSIGERSEECGEVEYEKLCFNIIPPECMNYSHLH